MKSLGEDMCSIVSKLTITSATSFKFLTFSIDDSITSRPRSRQVVACAALGSIPRTRLKYLDFNASSQNIPEAEPISTIKSFGISSLSHKSLMY